MPPWLPLLASLAAALLAPAAPAQATLALISSTTFNASGNSTDNAYAIARDGSGNIYVTGQVTQANGDVFIGKFSSELVLLASTTVNGSANANDQGGGITVDGSNVFVTGLVTESAGGANVWIARYDTALVLQASTTVNGGAGGTDQGNAIASDGTSVFVAGYVAEAVGADNIYVARYNSALVFQSSFTVNGAGSAQDRAWALAVDAAGALNIAGWVSNGANLDAYVGKYTSGLVLLASSTFNSGTDDALRGLTTDAGGSIRAVGWSNSNLFLATFTFTTTLTLTSSETYNGSGGGIDIGAAAAMDSSNNWFVGGKMVESLQGDNIWLSEHNSQRVLQSSVTVNGTGAGTPNDDVRGVVLDGSGNLFAAGYVNSSVGGDNLYLAKYSVIGAGPTPTAFPRADVGESSITFRWGTTGASCYRAQVRANDCAFGAITASSTTANLFAVFGTTSPGLDYNTIYCFRVAAVSGGTCVDGSGTNSAFGTVLTTSTLATTRSVSRFLPTPPGGGADIYSSTDVFSFTASVGNGNALNYHSTFTQTTPYNFNNATDPTWDGSTRTYRATSEGTWFHQASARNNVNVHDSTRTVSTFVFDKTPPVSVGGVRHFHPTQGEVFQNHWNNTTTPSYIRLVVQDSTAGLNTVGYSSGTSLSTVGLWHFDEGSGLRTANAALSGTPSDNDGYLRSLPAIGALPNGTTSPMWVPGRFGMALEFAKSSDSFVDTAYRGSFVDPLDYPGASLTVSAWVKPTSLPVGGSESHIVSRWNTQTDAGQYVLRLDGSGKPVFRVATTLSSPENRVEVTGLAALPLNQWSHVAAVVDGAGVGGVFFSSPTVTVYVNGVISTFTVFGANFTLLGQPSIPTLIGAGFYQGAASIPNAVRHSFTGVIDEVRIFKNDAVVAGPTPSAEIARDFASGLGWTPHVYLSTTAGATWQLVNSTQAASSPEIAVTGSQGALGTENFSLLEAELVTSTSALPGSGGTNQVQFILTDLAGNEMHSGTYAILVDTTAPVESNFRTQGSTSGAAGAVTSVSSASWSALAVGVTVQLDVRDITSGLSITTADFKVSYSTNGGATYNDVFGDFLAQTTAPYVTLSGPSSTTANQILALNNLNLVQSSPTQPTNNQVRFSVRDQARNLLNAVQFQVLVDTTVPGALDTLTPLTPYASGQIQLSWTAPANNAGGVDPLLAGSAFHIQHTTDPVLAANPAFWNPDLAQVVIPTGTIQANSGHLKLVSGLSNDGTQYYFRAYAKDPAGNFSPLSLGATAATLARPPTPLNLVAVTKGVSSITWSWDQTVLTSTYTVFSDTDTVTFLTSVSTPAGATASSTRVLLSTNTLYGVRVAAVNPAGQGALAAAVQEYTLAARPGTPAISSVSYSSVTFSWAANGNPGYTDYEVSQSLDGFVASASTPVPFALTWTPTTTTLLSLAPGTTYHFRVRAQNNQGDNVAAVKTALTAYTTTQTLPTVPVTQSSTTLGISSITWTWANTAGQATLFRVLTASAASVLTANLAHDAAQFTETGLATNTAYGVFVEAYVPTGSGDFTPKTTVYTLAAAPGTPALVTPGTATLAVSWASNGNPAYTEYEVSLATEAAFLGTAVSTPVAYAAGWTATTTTFLGLAPGTSYFYRAQARNNEPLGRVPTARSAVQLSETQPVAITGLAFSTATVSTDTAKWTWGPNGNGGATQYRLDQSIDGNSPTNLSALIGKPVTSTFTQTGLLPNHHYGLLITPETNTGTAAQSLQVGGYTLANPPVSPTVVAITSATVTLTWGANSNSAFTRYEVRRSTDDFSSDDNPTGATFLSNMTATTFTVSGLAPFTTYYFRVRAANNLHPVTPQDVGPGSSVKTAFATTVSTFTLAPVVGGIAGTALGISSISWTWDAVLNADGYHVFSATSGTQLVSTGAASFIETALATNTAYGIQVRAFNFSGIGPLSAGATRYTLATEPGQPAFTPVSSMTVSLSWPSRGNPTYTPYELEYSSDAFVSGSSAVITFAQGFTATASTVTSLASGTTYTFRLRARNGDGLVSANGVTASTRTLGIPATITDLAAFVFLPERIDLTWTAPGANGSSGFIDQGNFYVIYSPIAGQVDSTTTVTRLTLSQSITPGVQQSTAIVGLTPGTTYFLSVFTDNDEHVLSARSNTTSRLVPGTVRAFTIDTTAIGFSTISVGQSTVAPTAVTLVSTSNVAITYVLSAATITNGSPWTIARQPYPDDTLLADVIKVIGVFHPTRPSSFGAITGGNPNVDISTTPMAASGFGVYSMGTMSGEAVPPSASPCTDLNNAACQARSLWLGLDTSPYTTTDQPQTIGVTIIAQ